MPTFIAYRNLTRYPPETARRRVLRECQRAELPLPSFVPGPPARCWAEATGQGYYLSRLEAEIVRIYVRYLTDYLRG